MASEGMQIANETCTRETCSYAVDFSVHGFGPHLGINVTFIVLYSMLTFMSMISLSYCLRRRLWIWTVWTVLIGICCCMEMLGYLYRIKGWQDPWNRDAFLIQMTLLNIAPLFITSAMHISLYKLADAMGEGRFNIRPKCYLLLLIMDVVALTIQVIGDIITRWTNYAGIETTSVGLALQIALTLAFLFFLVAISQNKKPIETQRANAFGPIDPETAAPFGPANSGAAARAFEAPANNDPEDNTDNTEMITFVPSQTSSPGVTNKPPKRPNPVHFIKIVVFATIFIMGRSAFRIAELVEGATGPQFTNWWLFIELDGLLIAAAALPLVCGHPLISFDDCDPFVSSEERARTMSFHKFLSTDS